MHRFATHLLLLTASILVGCSNDEQSSAPANQPAAEQGGIKRVPADKLPPLADPLPPLDGGTVEIAGPEKAKVLPRTSHYICGFYYSSASSPPRILLTSEPSPLPSIKKTTEANLEEFATLTTKRLEEEGKKPLEPVLPMIIGGQPCVRYVLASRFKNADADRQILETIQNGKLYRLDLQVFAGQIVTYRDDAYAVLAGMKFTGSDEATAPKEPSRGEEPADTPAAEPDAQGA